MKTRYKIVIFSIVIISILLFLQTPSIFGVSECADEIMHKQWFDEIIPSSYDCRTWSNWDWIYYNIIERDDTKRIGYPGTGIPHDQTMAEHCPELALRQSLGLDLDKMCL